VDCWCDESSQPACNGECACAVERDRYREALKCIAYPETFIQSRSRLAVVAREALKDDPGQAV
jgi:hypothetical protein